MNATVCPINPPGHGWEAGLSCRWCDATRTPGEAVLSGLASVRGWSRDAARAMLDAYRAEVLTEGELLPKADVIAWLVKKAREERAGSTREDRVRADVIGVLASKVERGAIRPDNLRMLPADFFTPGRTYTVRGFAYQCEHTTHHPAKGEREAWGWLHRGGDVWRLERLYDADYTADVAQSGVAS